VAAAAAEAATAEPAAAPPPDDPAVVGARLLHGEYLARMLVWIDLHVSAIATSKFLCGGRPVQPPTTEEIAELEMLAEPWIRDKLRAANLDNAMASYLAMHGRFVGARAAADVQARYRARAAAAAAAASLEEPAESDGHAPL
jgi:hypothetical protein